mmetsp:Transcript_56460/g.134060  ORF Transcript_56460/g.134060 Transcript_56460/m.134060 type:complete len:209 (-) Transcript_56460:1146-1772(-)
MIDRPEFGDEVPGVDGLECLDGRGGLEVEAARRLGTGVEFSSGVRLEADLVHNALLPRLRRPRNHPRNVEVSKRRVSPDGRAVWQARVSHDRDFAIVRGRDLVVRRSDRKVEAQPGHHPHRHRPRRDSHEEQLPDLGRHDGAMPRRCGNPRRPALQTISANLDAHTDRGGADPGDRPDRPRARLEARRMHANGGARRLKCHLERFGER